tara:strand:+ start:216 stop:386 length:171 start_codon:yes stop_codon:yes gene_type:complete
VYSLILLSCLENVSSNKGFSIGQDFLVPNRENFFLGLLGKTEKIPSVKGEEDLEVG